MSRLTAGLVLLFTLTACTLQARLEGTPQAALTTPIGPSVTPPNTAAPATASPTLSAPPAVTSVVQTAAPTQTQSPVQPTTAAPSYTPSRPVPTRTPTPPPPPGGQPTTVPPTASPTLPPGVTPTAHIPAVIHLFHVSPFQDVKPGDPLTVVWEAEGNNARICQMGANGPTDCADVPMRGERQFAALNTDKPYWLVLYVNVGTFPEAEEIRTANIYVGCQHRWFFDQPEVPVCPLTAPLAKQAAAQQFERGWMLYLPDPGVYYGLVDEAMSSNWSHRLLLRAFDPLNILRDTSAQVTPPAGRVAPTSGFGYLWRGDAETYDDWRGKLGWGLAAEFNYTATYQCDDMTRRWQFCYVTHPEGWLVVLHPNVNWYPKSVTYVP